MGIGGNRMDSWFEELFDIIKKQKDPDRLELLMLKIYPEFDALVRERKINELEELYQFIRNNELFVSTNETQNLKTKIKCEQELIFRLALLDDFTMLNQLVEDLVIENDQELIKLYLEIWKDKSFIYTYLKERIKKQTSSSTKSRKKQKAFKVEIPVIPRERETEYIHPEPEPVPMKKEAKPEPEFEPEPVTTVEKPKIKETPPIKTPEPIKTEPEKPIVKQAEIEQKIQKTEPVKQNTIKKPTKKHIMGQQALEFGSTLKQEPKVNKTEKAEKSPPIKPDVPEQTKGKQQIELQPEPKTPKEIRPKEPTKKAFAVPKQAKQEQLREIWTPDFFEFIDLFIEQYPILINQEKLRQLSTPKPTFFRMVLEFVDSEERSYDFFIKFINFCLSYSMNDLVSYLVDKSHMLRKYASANIAFLNKPDIKKAIQLLYLLEDEIADYITNSFNELKLLRYVDQFYKQDEVTNQLIQQAVNASRFTPKMTELSFHIDSVKYFDNYVFNIKERLIDMTNINHLYWSMILATSICIYVERLTDTDYINSMEWVGETALQLAIHVDNNQMREIIETLALSYIRRIYKAGQSSPEYPNWWDRQIEDMRDAKLGSLDKVRSIEQYTT